jgi:hypothetical protein
MSNCDLEGFVDGSTDKKRDHGQFTLETFLGLIRHGELFFWDRR